MELKENLFKELVKKGPSLEDGKRVWDVSKRRLLYLTERQIRSFLNLRNHPRYQEIVVSKELSLMEKGRESINQLMDGECFNLIDMGCGDGTKAVEFMKLCENKNIKMRYCPVSVNQELIDLALKNVKAANLECVKDYESYHADEESLSEIASSLRSNNYQKNMILLLGNILASYDINDYLFELSNGMFKGDSIIIGNGIRKGERLVNIDTYKHPGFNDWFIHLMRSLGFEDDEVEYGVRFNEMRAELFYKLKKDREIEHNSKKVELKEGDEILVAVLYKFYEEELKKFCEMYFSDVKLFKDEEDEYSLVLCKK